MLLLDLMQAQGDTELPIRYDQFYQQLYIARPTPTTEAIIAKPQLVNLTIPS